MTASKNKNLYTDMSNDEMILMAKFAMLLRCSYLCSAVGVAFVNCVPVPVDNMAKRVLCASLFSEWLGKMIKIHNSYGFRMTVMAMGAFSADAVHSTFTSYKGSNTMVRYIGVTNPAAISYMNVVKIPGQHPIPNQITTIEAHVNSIVGMDTVPSNYTEYHWKTYPKDIVTKFMKEDTIGPLTKALVDHTAEDLAIPFLNMARNLFNSANPIPSGITPGVLPDTSDKGSVVSANMDQFADQAQQQTSVRKATGPIFAQQNQNQSAYQSPEPNLSQNTGSNQNQFANDRQLFIGRNSVIARMNDASGASKSQQTIILDNMIAKLETVLESFRSREKTIMKMSGMIETIVDRHSVEDDDLNDIVSAIKERFPTEIAELEEAVSVVAAMPAVIEGDTGVIEGVIQPAAPLMRRYDGTTMRDGVYEQMLQDRSNNVAQARNPPQTIGVFSNTGPNAAANMTQPMGNSMLNNALSNQSTSANAMRIMAETREKAWDLFMEAVEAAGNDDMIDAVQKPLFKEADSELNMAEIMTSAITAYMDAKQSEPPTGEAVVEMIKLMHPPTDANMNDVGTMIRDLSEHKDTLVAFFDNELMG